MGECASACFFIYVAAVERSAVGTWPRGWRPGDPRPPFSKDDAVAIHRPYFEPAYFAGLGVAEAEVKYRKLLIEVRRYLRAREVPEYLSEKMFSLASNEAYWLTREDLGRIGARPSWYDQLLVDRCNLNKQLERDLAEGKNVGAALKQVREVSRCAYSLGAAQGLSNLYSLLAKEGFAAHSKGR
jgi:hypothetical protein